MVIGRNEGDRLALCLRAARKATKHVVYVDSASTDESIALATKAGVTVVSLTASTRLTAARGRTAGLQRLLEDFKDCRYVQFVDGDCILQPGWMNAAYEYLNQHEVAGVVCGRRFEASPGFSLYNRLIDREWNTPLGVAEACGGDAMFKVEALRSVGPFRSELLAGEEPELCHRLRRAGWNVYRLDERMTEHDAGISTLRQWLRIDQRSGCGYAQVWSSTRGGGSPLYGRQILSAILWIVLIPAIFMVFSVAFSPRWILLLIFVYVLQVVRIARRFPSNDGWSFRIRAGALFMLSKTGELAGVVGYFLGSHLVPAASYRSNSATIPSA